MAVAKSSIKGIKEPNIQVSACIVNEDNRILSIGYLDECFLGKRDGKLNTKAMYVVNAKINAILNYRGNRRDFENAKIYIDLFPSNEYDKEIIQFEIKEVIYLISM